MRPQERVCGDSLLDGGGATGRTPSGARRALRALGRLARDRPLLLALGVACALVIGVPLAIVRYPPMSDLPFHAAQSATLRHYWDPAFHFQEQFELRPLAVPYLSMYALSALLMLVMSPLAATKLAAAVMLGLLPSGLAVLCHGMKKSPFLGVFGLLAVWTPLTHWSFLNFLGALGLFAMALGFTLIVLDRGARSARVGLALSLVAIFFTHIYRYPIAVVGVVGAALLVRPEVRRLRELALPLAPSLALFAVWWRLRPASLVPPPTSIGIHLERLAEIPAWHVGAFVGPGERVSWAIALALVLAFVVIGGFARREPSPGGWRAASVAAAAALGSLLLYLTLPMAINEWWYVYPREATSALLFALALLPDLPRAPRPRAAMVALSLAAPVPMALTVAADYAPFDAQTADFDAIIARIPQAPKLMYVIYDHSGTNRTVSPFTHLPAYVQAEKGGWLSYHFEKYGASPLIYRPREGREDVIPPPTPISWEYRPELFDVLRHGPFFDWFLVRSRVDPWPVLEADPELEPVAHEGLWWLYQRTRRAPSRATPRPQDPAEPKE